MPEIIFRWLKGALPKIIILFVVLLFGAVAYLLPLAIATIVLICLGIGMVIGFELRWLPLNVPAAKDLSLSSVQVTNLQEAEDQIRTIGRRLDEIKQEGEGLRHHMDGSYDRKTQLGKALNKEFLQLLLERERLRVSIQDVRYGPLKALRELFRVSSTRMAYRWAVSASVVMALLLYFGGAKLVPAPVLLVGYTLGYVVYTVRRLRLARSFADEQISLEQLSTGRDLKPEDTVPDGVALTGWPDVSADETLAAWRERIRKPHPDLKKIHYQTARGMPRGLMRGAITVLFAALFAAMAYLWPPAITDISLICLGIGLLIGFERRWIPLKVPAAKDLGLSSVQAAKLQEAESQIRIIDRRLDEIKQEGKGLHHHMDGSYDRKTQLGKALNEELQQLLPAREHLRVFIQDVRYGPLNALRELFGVSSMRVACWWAASCGVVMALLFHFNVDKPVFEPVIIGYVLGLVVYIVRRGRLARSFADEVSSLEQLSTGRDLKPEDIVPDGVALTEWPDASADEILAAWRERIRRPHQDHAVGL